MRRKGQGNQGKEEDRKERKSRSKTKGTKAKFEILAGRIVQSRVRGRSRTGGESRMVRK